MTSNHFSNAFQRITYENILRIRETKIEQWEDNDKEIPYSDLERLSNILIDPSQKEKVGSYVHFGKSCGQIFKFIFDKFNSELSKFSEKEMRNIIGKCDSEMDIEQMMSVWKRISEDEIKPVEFISMIADLSLKLIKEYEINTESHANWDTKSYFKTKIENTHAKSHSKIEGFAMIFSTLWKTFTRVYSEYEFRRTWFQRSKIDHSTALVFFNIFNTPSMTIDEIIAGYEHITEEEKKKKPPVKKVTKAKSIETKVKPVEKAPEPEPEPESAELSGTEYYSPSGSEASDSDSD